MRALKVLKNNDLYEQVHQLEDEEQYRVIDYFFYYTLEEINQETIHMESYDIIVGFVFFENVRDKTIHSFALWHLCEGETFTSLGDIPLTINMLDEEVVAPDLLNIFYTEDKVVDSEAHQWEFIELVLEENHSVFIWQSGILNGDKNEHLRFKVPALAPYTTGYIESVEVINGKALNAQIIFFDNLNGEYLKTRSPIIVDNNGNHVILISVNSTTVVTNLNELIKDDKCLIDDIHYYLNSIKLGILMISGEDHDGFYKARIECFNDEVHEQIKKYDGVIDYDFTINESI